MSESAEMNDRRNRRRPLNLLLYACLLLAAAFAAWQISVFLEGRKASVGRRRPELYDTGRFRSGQGAAAEPSDPIGSAQGWAGLRPLEGDPGGMAPPAGAQRRSAFARELQDATEEVASYEYAGEVPAAAAHYGKVASAMDLRLLADQETNGRRILTFLGERTEVRVSLREGRRDYKIVNIVVSVRRRKT